MPVSSIPIPQINFGRVKAKTQMVLLITNYGEVVRREMETFLQTVIDHKSKKAYLMDWEEQMLGEDGQMYQVIYEKSCLPVCFTDEPETKEEQLETVLNNIFEESFQMKINTDLENAGKNLIWDKITLIISLVCGTILVVAFMQWRAGA